MKALKTTATVLLAALAMAVGLTAEALALARCTVLDSGFYGETGRKVYELAGDKAVRMMADAVLERAPAVALRTTDREEAYALARKALPPERIADMLVASGPDIAHFILKGGDIPVLKGAAAFVKSEESVVRGLLLDGLWDMLPQKPSFPAFMPFTPEWNLVYGDTLSRNLWLARFYLGMADHALGLLLSVLTLLTGALYLLWLRERRPFFVAAGTVLVVNGLLLCALAAAAAYYSRPIAEAAAAHYPVSAASELFAAGYPELVRAILLPFRQVFFLAAMVSLSFGVTVYTMGIGPKPDNAAPIPKKNRHGSGKETRHIPKHIRKSI